MINPIIGMVGFVGRTKERQPASDQRVGAVANHPLTLSKSAEHFTPEWILNSARKVMGTIDVDPCSCAEAQERVRARRWYDRGQNGLIQPWRGRLFINPPGDIRGKLPKLFWRKLVVEVERRNVKEFIWLAFNLSHLRTLQFDTKLLPQCDICVLRDRIRFTGDSPTKDNALVYWGRNGARFTQSFSPSGMVWRGQRCLAHKRTLPACRTRPNGA